MEFVVKTKHDKNSLLIRQLLFNRGRISDDEFIMCTAHRKYISTQYKN